MDSYIKCGDCLELMKEIPDKSVDMILCDLPYGVTQNKWDSVIPFEPLWQQYHRITKDNAAIVLNCMQPFSSALVMSNPKEFKYMWYWDKHLKTGFLNSKRQPLRQVEEIAVFYRRQCHFAPPEKLGRNHARCRQGTAGSNYNKVKQRVTTFSDSYCATTLITDYPKNVCNSNHPTEKPIGLLEYLIRTYTVKGDVVLDNCMGSGSTCVAARNLGRKYIGIELDENYYRIAEQRLSEQSLTNQQLSFESIGYQN